MPQALEHSVIRILNASGETAGTGFLIGDRLAVTCAHVAALALGLKEGSDSEACGKTVHAQPRGADRVYTATISSAWSPVAQGDVAFLCFAEALNGAQPVRLAYSRCSRSSEYTAFGFARGEETWDQNMINGPVEDQNGYTRLQLVGNAMEPGFSGGPVLDIKLDRVIGMVTWGKSGTYQRTIQAVTVETIGELWPGLEIDDPEKILGLEEPVEPEKTTPNPTKKDSLPEDQPRLPDSPAPRSHAAFSPGSLGPIAAAVGIYLLLVFMLASAASVRLIIPLPVLRKVLQSDYPNISLIVFCAGVVAFLWILLRLGIEVRNLPLKLSAAVQKNIRRLSLWYPTGFFSASMIVFFLISHPCQPAAVTFRLNQTQVIQPNAVITAAPGSYLLFSVSPVEDAAIGCIWSRAGSGITRLSQTSGCSSTVQLSSEPGSAILTVAVNEGICANRDNFAFPLLIRNP